MFGFGSAAGIVFRILLPIPFKTLALNIMDALRTTMVHRSSSTEGGSRCSQCDLYRQPGGQQLLKY